MCFLGLKIKFNLDIYGRCHGEFHRSESFTDENYVGPAKLHRFLADPGSVSCVNDHSG